MNAKVVSADEKSPVKTKNGIQSVLVSLPLPHTGILHHKSSLPDNRHLETGSVDSMRQELCYFKPIEGTTPTRYVTKNFVLFWVSIIFQGLYVFDLAGWL